MRPAGTGAVDTAATEASVPLCPCHQEPMRWKPDRAELRGGTWLCVPKESERQRRYDRSDKGRARKRAYNASENAKSSKWLYDLTRVRTI